VNPTASEIVSGPGLSLDAVVLVGGADAVEAIATVDHGATWQVTDPYAPIVTVVESTELGADPFDLAPDFCGYPIPAWQGELVDQDGDAQDLDGTDADLGATGGPDADPALWADDDGDGIAAMWDCDDSDPAAGVKPDCTTPTTPTSPSTAPVTS